MNLIDKKLAEAKRDIQKIEGAVRYVTAKGHIRKNKPEKWETEIYKVYVKNGIVYTEREGKQISPKKEAAKKPESREESKSKKTKNISDV